MTNQKDKKETSEELKSKNEQLEIQLNFLTDSNQLKNDDGYFRQRQLILLERIALALESSPIKKE